MSCAKQSLASTAYDNILKYLPPYLQYLDIRGKSSFKYIFEDFSWRFTIVRLNLYRDRDIIIKKGEYLWKIYKRLP